jgi:hypothetical protein
VLGDFGQLGCVESRDQPRAGRSGNYAITDLMSGQFDNPVRVVAFNTAERWSRGCLGSYRSGITRRVGLSGGAVPPLLEAFVDSHLGSEP